jgi:hypothetical protein
MTPVRRPTLVDASVLSIPGASPAVLILVLPGVSIFEVGIAFDEVDEMHGLDAACDS